MQKLKNIFIALKINVILKILRNLILFLISVLIPKSKRIVIIGGWFGKRFADNSKYTFLYISNYAKELGFKKVVYVTRSKNIQKEINEQKLFSVSFWSLQSIWYHFRAYFHIIDQSYKDINSIFSTRSKRIHLWHGFPLKRIGEIDKYMTNGTYSSKNLPPKESRILKFIKKVSSDGIWNDFYMLGTSKLSSEILSKAFNVPSDKMFISGYPRNFNLYLDETIKFFTKEEKEIRDKIASYSTSKKLILGYFPTFRDRAKTNLFGTENINEAIEYLNLCENLNISVVTKFHSAEKTTFDEIVNHNALINLPSYFDIYNFLEYIDIVISDYSSIAFDFLILDKPTVFFPYDLDYYSTRDRKLIFDYSEFSPGPLVNNIDELKSLTPKLVDNFQDFYEKEFGDKAKKLREKIYSNYKKFDIFHFVNQIKNI